MDNANYQRNTFSHEYDALFKDMLLKSVWSRIAEKIPQSK